MIYCEHNWCQKTTSNGLIKVCDRCGESAAPPPPAAQQDDGTGPEAVCAQAYQVVGSLLSDVGHFDTELGDKILDNLSQAKLIHEVLPWPSFAAQQDVLVSLRAKVAGMEQNPRMGDAVFRCGFNGAIRCVLDAIDASSPNKDAAQQGSAEAVASSPDKVRAALMELELFVRVLGLDSEPARKAAEMAREALATGSTPRAGVVTKNAVAWKYRNPKKPHLWKVTMTKPINTGMEVVPLVEMPNPAPTDPAVLRDLALRWKGEADDCDDPHTAMDPRDCADQLLAAIAAQAKGGES